MTNEILPLGEGLGIDEGIRIIRGMKKEMGRVGLLKEGRSFEVRMLGESEGSSTGKNLVPYLWAAGICTREVQFYGLACFDSEGARNAQIKAFGEMGTTG